MKENISEKEYLQIEAAIGEELFKAFLAYNGGELSDFEFKRAMYKAAASSPACCRNDEGELHQMDEPEMEVWFDSLKDIIEDLPNWSSAAKSAYNSGSNIQIFIDDEIWMQLMRVYPIKVR